MGGQGRHPIGPVGAQDGHEHVPLLHAPGLEQAGRLAAQPAQIPKAQFLPGAPVVLPHQRRLVWHQAGQGVDDVVAVVEVLRVVVRPAADLPILVECLMNKLCIKFRHKGTSLL